MTVHEHIHARASESSRLAKSREFNTSTTELSAGSKLTLNAFSSERCELNGYDQHIHGKMTTATLFLYGTFAVPKNKFKRNRFATRAKWELKQGKSQKRFVLHHSAQNGKQRP